MMSGVGGVGHLECDMDRKAIYLAYLADRDTAMLLLFFLAAVMVSGWYWLKRLERVRPVLIGFVFAVWFSSLGVMLIWTQR